MTNVATRRDFDVLTKTSISPRFSDRFIVTPERHDASRIKSEQLWRRDYVAIALRLRHDVSWRNFDVVMRHNLRRDSEKIKKT